MPALYSMRWAIKVYFKEAKQYLGFLKEQSKNYGAYIASIHLMAIRFCMLVTAKSLNQEEIRYSFGKITQTINRHIQEFFMQTLQLDVKTMRLEVE